MKIVIRARPRSSPSALHVGRAAVKVTSRPLRVLDFDIENRPLSYLGSDFTTAEVTAIAWAWCDRPDEVTVYLLGDTDLPTILREFAKVYSNADVVTGHYIRGHDLPMLNGAMMEFALPTLGNKLSQDTKLDLMRSKGLSLSQESLGAMFRLDHQKVQMNQIKWRTANRLTPEGLAEVRARVVGDVREHIELRQRLLDLGYLRGPQMWRSLSGEPTPEYVP